MVSNDSLYTHISSQPLILVEKPFISEGARPEKGLKIWPFSKMLNPKSSVFNNFHKSKKNFNDI